MSVEVEIPDERHVASCRVELLANTRDLRSRFRRVDRDAYDLGTRAPQLFDLARGCLRVRGIRIGHRLHDDRRPAPDAHVAHRHLPGFAAH